MVFTVQLVITSMVWVSLGESSVQREGDSELNHVQGEKDMAKKGLKRKKYDIDIWVRGKVNLLGDEVRSLHSTKSPVETCDQIAKLEPVSTTVC